MNKGIKTIGTIVSLLLLSVLLFVILISAIYPLPFQLERFRFFSLTNFYLRHYIFWVAIAFSILLILGILILLFYPKTIRSFLLKKGNGELVLDKKAIEAPKVNVKATKNKLSVGIKGELRRTSSLIGKTGTLMKDIEKEIKHVLGEDEPVQVSVKYTGYQEPTNKRSADQARVE